MKILWLVVMAFPALTRLLAAEPGAREAADLLMDQVWSGHPVGFALLTERGHQFIAYYNAARKNSA